MVDLKELGSWERPEITGFGRLPGRPPLVPSDALPLDGRWEFKLNQNPEEATDGIHRVPDCAPRYRRGGGVAAWELRVRAW